VNFLLPPLDKGRVGVGKKFTTHLGLLYMAYLQSNLDFDNLLAIIVKQRWSFGLRH